MAFTDDPRGLHGQRATDALHHEMRTRFGSVPESLAAPVFDEDGFMLATDSFLFTTDSGIRYFYSLGQGIVAFLPDTGCTDEFRLYLWGTVFGAVAWLNGYFPLHASAVAVDGRAIAFTADSGVGKSTLAAALAARGFPHVCDDTLALSLSTGAPVAIPDRKPLKLWEDAFAFAGARRIEPITSMPGKSYASAAIQNREPLPLTDLIVLGEGERISLTPVRGVAKLDSLVEAMYRGFIPTALGRRVAYNSDLLALANSIGIWKLARPRARDAAEFEASTEQIAALIGSIPRIA